MHHASRIIHHAFAHSLPPRNISPRTIPATIKHPHGHEFPAPPPNPPPPPDAVTLFERLGQKEGITRLVKWFYARVRFDPLLEPIFNAHVPKWGEHLDLLIDYWCGAV